jgi:Uncharacterised nucleotidyltransferase
MSSPVRLRRVAPIVAGTRPKWRDQGMSADALLEICEAEDLATLIHHRLAMLDGGGDWPPNVLDELAVKARAATGQELLRGVEIRAVIEALATAGIRALLIKGTPLAYSVYPTPAARPRDDTDLMIPAAHVDAARGVMASLGYTDTVYCSDLFSQFEVQKRDRFGVVHAFDVHWKISTQPVFADALSYSEMLRDAVPVPALGAAAFAPGPVDALLLACIHPAMHHQNAERLLWIYDTHLLASLLTDDELCDFARRAVRKRVAAVCAHRIRLAHAMFETRVPAAAMRELSAAGDEPSAAYLASQRRWRHELISSVRGLPRVGDRVALLRNVLLPSPSYMLGTYGLRGKPLAPWLLPALYVHRGVRGAWKILAGKK